MGNSEMPLIRRIGYYSIGLIVPFIFARPIITLLENVLSFDKIFSRRNERNVLTTRISSPINHISKYKRGFFGIFFPWWLIKLIFEKKD
jgi:hypothetical protein